MKKILIVFATFILINGCQQMPEPVGTPSVTSHQIDVLVPSATDKQVPADALPEGVYVTKIVAIRGQSNLSTYAKGIFGKYTTCNIILVVAEGDYRDSYFGMEILPPMAASKAKGAKIKIYQGTEGNAILTIPAPSTKAGTITITGKTIPTATTPQTQMSSRLLGAIIEWLL